MYDSVKVPRGAVVDLQVGVLSIFENTKSVSAVEFDVTVHPAAQSSGPLAAPKRTVANSFVGDTPTAIDEAYEGPDGLLFDEPDGGANALSTPAPSATTAPVPPYAQQDGKGAPEEAAADTPIKEAIRVAISRGFLTSAERGEGVS